MNIKETFLSLTRHTYPHGTEHGLFDILPQNLEMDEFGNLFIKIGESDTMFTSHLDTATSANTPVNHVFENDIIKTDGKSILGADDKAGVTIMLYMIEKEVPGLYYFFLGEEVGCIGSKKVAQKHKTEKLDYIKKVVSFDRRGTDSVITFQASQRCCSDSFAKALATELNRVCEGFKYEPDPSGIYTDSAQFTEIYPECTNISVGYYSEHTYSERQDIEHLSKLAEAVTQIDWVSLPSERDPNTFEYRSYGSYYGGSTSYGSSYGTSSYQRPKYGRYSYYDDYWDEDDWNYSAPALREDKISFHDEEFNFISTYSTDKTTKDYTKVDIHKKRIDRETNLIIDFLKTIELDYKTITWDGVNLFVNYELGKVSDCNRKELIEYIPELDLSKLIYKKKDYGFSEPEDYCLV